MAGMMPLSHSMLLGQGMPSSMLLVSMPQFSLYTSSIYISTSLDIHAACLLSISIYLRNLYISNICNRLYPSTPPACVCLCVCVCVLILVYTRMTAC